MGRMAPSPTSLSIHERLDVFKAIATWIRIKTEQGQAITEADASHSALLDWLLSGNQPLPYPPPVLYSRPDHGLAKGEARHLMDPPVDFNDRVLVAQNADWVWFEKSSNRLKHLGSGTIYKWDPDNSTLQKAE